MTVTPNEIYYRSEDAQQILNIAIARQAETGELTRSQLLEIASELNIAAADIVAAEQEWVLRQGELAERQRFDRMRQGRFQSRLVRYGIMAGFLSALTLVAPAWLTAWVVVPILWGLGFATALAAWKTYGLSEEDYNNAFLQWRQRQQLKRSVVGLLNRCLGIR
ncbi:MAG: 2TM domain-containing protein [Elainella sp.]